MNRLARLLRRLGAAFLVRDDRTPAGHALRSGASRHAKLSSLMLGTATLALALVAQAGSQAKLIDHERLLLGDLTRDVPEYLARFDLGEAPPPGGARTLLRVEVLRALREAGVEIDKLSLPGSMRVEGATRRWSREELIPWLSPVVTAALPEGVTLVDLSPFGALVTSPSATPAAVQLARLPKRAGRVSTTALVELRRDGRPLQRVSVSLVVDVSAQAARFAIGLC